MKQKLNMDEDLDKLRIELQGKDGLKLGSIGLNRTECRKSYNNVGEIAAVKTYAFAKELEHKQRNIKNT